MEDAEEDDDDEEDDEDEDEDDDDDDDDADVSALEGLRVVPEVSQALMDPSSHAAKSLDAVAPALPTPKSASMPRGPSIL